MTQKADQDPGHEAGDELGLEGFDIFDLGAQGGEDPETSETEETAETSETSNPVAEELAALKAQYEAERRASQATIDRLMQGLAVRNAAPSGAALEEADDVDMPDVLEDPKGYAKAMRDLIRRETTAAVRGATASGTREQRIKQITDQFYTDNEDLRSLPEFVNAAYAEEARHYAQIGVNIQDALLEDPAGVSARVADRVRARAQDLGIQLRREADETPAGFGAPSRGRTAGVAGRSAKPAASAAARNGKADAGDFASELREYQRTSGFF